LKGRLRFGWRVCFLTPPGEKEKSSQEIVQGGKILAQYTAGPFASQAALIENRVGAGRALYLGWYPTYEQVITILAYLADQAGIERLADLPPGLVASRRGPYTILLNFTEEDLAAKVGERTVAVRPRDVSIIQ
jgi:beta-galactosidase GanA